MKQANIGQGPGPALGHWNLLHFKLWNMHSSTFPGTFSSNYLMYICVGKLQNIFFNMKDSEHFGKCNFPFLYLKQSMVLFVHLLLYADTLLYKLGVWGPLRAPDAITLLTVKCAFFHFSWYFFLKNLTYIYAGTYTKYLFQYKAWQICSSKLVLFADTLVCRPGV